MAIAIDTNKITIGAATSLELGGTDLGPTTEDGVTIKADQSYEKLFCDQQVTAVKNVLVERTYTVEANLMHTNIANLHKALNLATGKLSASTLTLDGSEAPLATLIVVAPAPYSGVRTYIFDSVRVISNFAITHKKRLPSATLPVTFEALYNSTTSRNGIAGDA